jgi:hypothetical protein
MLENHRRSLSTGESVHTIVSRENSGGASLSPPTSIYEKSESNSLQRANSLRKLRSLQSFSSIGSESEGGERGKRVSKKGQYSSVRNHMELQRILHEDSVAGRAVRKVANAAAKFVKERDYVLISAFETSALDYPNFRILLKRMFFLDFTDEEFIQVCEMFDIYDHREVNGSEFIVVFTILSNLLKNEKRKAHRERKENDELKWKESQEKKIRELNSIKDSLVDYNFSEAERRNALDKLNSAAAIFDRTHHTAKSLKAFERAYMEPIEFRDALKGTFDITLTPKELGALVVHYCNGLYDDLYIS